MTSTQLLWASGFVLNFALLIVLIVKKRYRTLPWFTVLIAQDVIQSVVLFAVRHSPRINFYTYWSFDLLDAVLWLAVTWEVTCILIHKQLGRRIYEEVRSYLPTWLLLMVATIPLVIYSSPSGNVALKLALRIGFASTIAVGSVMVMMLWLTALHQIKLGMHAQAIVYGLTFYLVGRFVVHDLVMLVGLKIWNQAEVWLKPAYHICLILWIICLWRDESEPVPSRGIYKADLQSKPWLASSLPVAGPK